MAKRPTSKGERTFWLTLALVSVVALAFLLPTNGGCEFDTAPRIIIPPTPRAGARGDR